MPKRWKSDLPCHLGFGWSPMGQRPPHFLVQLRALSARGQMPRCPRGGRAIFRVIWALAGRRWASALRISLSSFGRYRLEGKCPDAQEVEERSSVSSGLWLVADGPAPSAFPCPASGAIGSRANAQMPKRWKSDLPCHLGFGWSPMGQRPPHFLVQLRALSARGQMPRCPRGGRAIFRVIWALAGRRWASALRISLSSFGRYRLEGKCPDAQEVEERSSVSSGLWLVADGPAPSAFPCPASGAIGSRANAQMPKRWKSDLPCHLGFGWSPMGQRPPHFLVQLRALSARGQMPRCPRGGRAIFRVIWALAGRRWASALRISLSSFGRYRLEGKCPDAQEVEERSSVSSGLWLVADGPAPSAFPCPASGAIGSRANAQMPKRWKSDLPCHLGFGWSPMGQRPPHFLVQLRALSARGQMPRCPRGGRAIFRVIWALAGRRWASALRISLSSFGRYRLEGKCPDAQEVEERSSVSSGLWLVADGPAPSAFPCPASGAIGSRANAQMPKRWKSDLPCHLGFGWSPMGQRPPHFLVQLRALSARGQMPRCPRGGRAIFRVIWALAGRRWASALRISLSSFGRYRLEGKCPDAQEVEERSSVSSGLWLVADGPAPSAFPCPASGAIGSRANAQMPKRWKSDLPCHLGFGWSPMGQRPPHFLVQLRALSARGQMPRCPRGGRAIFRVIWALAGRRWASALRISLSSFGRYRLEGKCPDAQEVEERSSVSSGLWLVADGPAPSAFPCPASGAIGSRANAQMPKRWKSDLPCHLGFGWSPMGQRPPHFLVQLRALSARGQMPRCPRGGRAIFRVIWALAGRRWASALRISLSSFGRYRLEGKCPDAQEVEERSSVSSGLWLVADGPAPSAFPCPASGAIGSRANAQMPKRWKSDLPCHLGFGWSPMGQRPPHFLVQLRALSARGQMPRCPRGGRAIFRVIWALAGRRWASALRISLSSFGRYRLEGKCPDAQEVEERSSVSSGLWLVADGPAPSAFPCPASGAIGSRANAQMPKRWKSDLPCHLGFGWSPMGQRPPHFLVQLRALSARGQMPRCPRGGRAIFRVIWALAGRRWASALRISLSSFGRYRLEGKCPDAQEVEERSSVSSGLWLVADGPAPSAFPCPASGAIGSRANAQMPKRWKSDLPCHLGFGWSPMGQRPPHFLVQLRALSARGQMPRCPRGGRAIFRVIWALAGRRWASALRISLSSFGRYRLEGKCPDAQEVEERSSVSSGLWLVADGPAPSAFPCPASGAIGSRANAQMPKRWKSDLPCHLGFGWSPMGQRPPHFLVQLRALSARGQMPRCPRGGRAIFRVIWALAGRRWASALRISLSSFGRYRLEGKCPDAQEVEERSSVSSGLWLVADGPAPSAFPCPASGAIGSRANAQMPKRWKSDLPCHLGFGWSPMGQRPPHFLVQLRALSARGQMPRCPRGGRAIFRVIWALAGRRWASALRISLSSFGRYRLEGKCPDAQEVEERSSVSSGLWLVADGPAPSAFPCPASGAIGSRANAQMPKRWKSDLPCHLGFGWSPMGQRPPHFLVQLRALSARGQMPRCPRGGRAIFRVIWALAGRRWASALRISLSL